MDTPEAPRPDLSELPPPVLPGSAPPPPPVTPPPAAPTPAAAPQRKGPRPWVWIVVIAALLVGGGATAFVLVSQANQAAAHEAALGSHEAAISAYDAAWTEFEQQNDATRDDQSKLSMTSLDNTEEVVASFAAAITAADALERSEFTPPSGDATDADISADTTRVVDATSDVEQVTQQLADASKLFLDSHRAIEAANLTTQADTAEASLTEVRDRADADLVAQLEQAIADARALAADPKAHPTDLRTTMQELVTLTGQVQDSAGPRVEDVNGNWVLHGTEGAQPFGTHMTIDYPAGSAGLLGREDGGSFSLSVADDGTLTGVYSFNARAGMSTEPRRVESPAVMAPAGAPWAGEYARHCPSGVQAVLNDTSIDRLYIVGYLQESCGAWVRE